LPNAGVQPLAMMIHFQPADLTLTAMMASLGLFK